MAKLYYEFEIRSGSSTYDDRYGEEYYDTITVGWEYEVSDDMICEAFIEWFSEPNQSRNEKVISTIYNLLDEKELTELLLEYDVSNVEDIIIYENEKSAPKMLKNILQDISYYADKNTEELIEFFYEEALSDYYDYR